MPPETIEAFRDHGEVAATPSQRASTRRIKLRRPRGPRRRLRRRRPHGRAGRHAEVLRLLRRDPRRRRGPSETPSLREGELVERIWERDATVLDRRATRRSGSAGSTSRCACSERVDELAAFAESTSRRGSTPSCLLGMGGSSLAPEVLRRHVRRRRVPRPRHDAPAARSARSRRSSTSSGRSSSPRRSRARRSRRARTPTTSGSKAGKRRRSFVAITDPGLGARAARARARLPRASSTASRRSAAATRRCRRSGSCPRR